MRGERRGIGFETVAGMGGAIIVEALERRWGGKLSQEKIVVTHFVISSYDCPLHIIAKTRGDCSDKLSSSQEERGSCSDKMSCRLPVLPVFYACLTEKP